jgi:hypothetical protein
VTITAFSDVLMFHFMSVFYNKLYKDCILPVLGSGKRTVGIRNYIFSGNLSSEFRSDRVKYVKLTLTDDGC